MKTNLTKSQIFKAAHKLAKRYEGSYQARFALALKEVYKVIAFANAVQKRDSFVSCYINPKDIYTIEGSYRAKRSEAYTYNFLTRRYYGGKMAQGVIAGANAAMS
jgi:hypothetical protein